MLNLSTFEPAAVEMAYRLGQQPYESCTLPGGREGSVWMLHALRMAEHALMVEVMRNFGHPV
jgi:hypothetical protein